MNHLPTETPAPCAEWADLFSEVIDLTLNTNKGTSKRRRAAEKVAKAICQTCPQRAECLRDYGRDYELGVVAGLTDDERRRRFEGVS